MNTNRSAASENPQFRVVIQFTTLSGMWSRKIAQLATPRNRSSRRSRPLSGRVALIFMGPFSKSCFREDRAVGQGGGRARAMIVTAQHNDYTGRENVTSKAGNHRSIPERCFYTILAVSTTRFNAAFFTGPNHP